MRFVSLAPVLVTVQAAVLAYGLAVYPAAADRGPDHIPYPLEADSPAAKPDAKPVAKPAIKPSAKPAVKPAAAPNAEAATEPPLPPVRPALPNAAASVEPTPAATPRVETPKDRTAIAETKPDVFARIPHDERLKLQAALLWSGDYSGAVNGDDPMLAAVKNFQKRIKAKVTGQLTHAERTRLLAAANDHHEEFGWSVVADPATGIRIGLPVKMVPHAREAANGTRWSSRHGDIQVETFRIAEPGLKLAALFEREKNRSPRKVEHSTLRDDGFFISGLQGLKRFSVRAQMRNGEVRGFTMMFDQAMEGIVAPVMVAMASAFSPFPQRSAPFAALAKSVDYGNGLIVSAQGHIVTNARLVQGCQVIVANGLGDAERIVDDKDKGLALLRIYGPRQLSPLALPRHAPAAKGDVSIAGMPDPKEDDGRAKLIEIKAKLNNGNALELRDSVPMAGFSGAAAIDASGRFVGLTEMRNAVLASIQPSVPPVRLVRSDTIRAFLDAHKVAQPPASNADPRTAVVRIICVRK